MILITALALGAAQPAAKPPAAPPAPTAQDQTARISQALAGLGFSAAAIPMLLQPLDTPAARDAMIVGLRQANAAILTAAAAKPFDYVAFDKAVRDRQTIRADAESRRAGQWSALIRRLPAADRPLFARTLVPHMSAPSPAPPPAPAAPSK